MKPGKFSGECVRARACPCVCVCDRERERKSSELETFSSVVSLTKKRGTKLPTGNVRRAHSNSSAA